MKFRIHTWPEKILKTSCRDVREVTPEIRTTLDEMYAYMKISDGVGLAANQVGLDLKLLVAEWENKVFKLINPSIIQEGGIVKSREGCLSFPKIELDIKRAKEVTVIALNQQGKQIKINAEGILAVILQHEIDHLNGIVFIDRISFLKRILIIPKLKAIKRNI